MCKKKQGKKGFFYIHEFIRCYSDKTVYNQTCRACSTLYTNISPLGWGNAVFYLYLSIWFIYLMALIHEANRQSAPRASRQSALGYFIYTSNAVKSGSMLWLQAFHVCLWFIIRTLWAYLHDQLIRTICQTSAAFNEHLSFGLDV